jgi:hypothetical protein
MSVPVVTVGTMSVLTWSGVTARRMARHALAEPAADLDPAGIASLLCGAHAQVLSAAELSMGRRIAGATRADVQRALWQERTLVKTFGPRGTVHLLPAEFPGCTSGGYLSFPHVGAANDEQQRDCSDYRSLAGLGTPVISELSAQLPVPPSSSQGPGLLRGAKVCDSSCGDWCSGESEQFWYLRVG